MRKFFQTKRMMSFVCVLFTAILSLCSINIMNYHDLLTTSTEEQTLNETDETNGGGNSQSDILENDEVTANAPTNSGYWTDSGNYATSFAGGSGTSSDPYLIETPQQLAYLSYLVNNSSTNSQYASLYYKQTANLDMSAYWWDAIGTSTYPFKGYYDGGDYTISNLLVDDNSNYEGLLVMLDLGHRHRQVLFMVEKQIA